MEPCVMCQKLVPSAVVAALAELGLPPICSVEHASVLEAVSWVELLAAGQRIA